MDDSVSGMGCSKELTKLGDHSLFSNHWKEMSQHSNTWHVYPQNDLKPHDLEGYGCECKPDVKYYEDDEFVMVVHNAFDKREKLEAYNMGPINEN